MSSRILLVEDEPGLVLTLSDLLRAEGYTVESAIDGITGLARALNESFELIVLDVMLPGKNGLEVCRELRQRGKDVAVLMLTAKTQLIDRVVGLKLGADDYLTKPFGSGELLARIRVALRHSAESAGAATEPVVEIGPLRMDFASREVFLDGLLVHLSPNEYGLLAVLVRHAGKVLTHKQLLHDVWGGVPAAQPTYLRVYMASLRKKLEPDPARPRLLITEPGVGYRLKA